VCYLVVVRHRTNPTQQAALLPPSPGIYPPGGTVTTLCAEVTIDRDGKLCYATDAVQGTAILLL